MNQKSVRTVILTDAALNVEAAHTAVTAMTTMIESELWPTHQHPLCAYCKLELFADESFICSDCRYNDDDTGTLEFWQRCVRASFGEPVQMLAAWRIV